MPPSCSVRRRTTSSPYAPLLGEAEGRCEQSSTSPHPPGHDETPQLLATASPRARSWSTLLHSSPTTTRHRSPTLASLFSDPNVAQIPSPHLGETVSPILDRSQLLSTVSADGGGSIQRPGLVTGHLASRRSRLTLNVPTAPDGAPSEVVAHGSQIDVLVPNENLQGVVGGALSHALPGSEHHDDDVVEHLEVIDPQVAAVSHLSNAANSILIPSIPSLYSRKPVIHLARSYDETTHGMLEKGGRKHMDEIDRHVEHVLGKRDRLRRTAAGVWSFVKTPMGIITAVYGFCVVFWGAAIVLFLAGWIPTSNSDRKGFWVEVSSQVENALFTVTGVGLIPWRVMDTYRILHIWYYKRMTHKLRKKAGLPALYDEDDLPDPVFDVNYVHVLTDKQQKALHHQQVQFSKSQTWYRPHGTQTHRAFPILTALLICLFVDGNSVFQVILCGCMWGLNRFQRPAWTTGTLIPASFMCGIIAAILIWRGGQKTKRTKEVEETLRAALAKESEAGGLAVTVPTQPFAPSRSLGGPATVKHETSPDVDQVEHMFVRKDGEPQQSAVQSQPDTTSTNSETFL